MHFELLYRMLPYEEIMFPVPFTLHPVNFCFSITIICVNDSVPFCVLPISRIPTIPFGVLSGNPQFIFCALASKHFNILQP